jgi:hypothetical protein
LGYSTGSRWEVREFTGLRSPRRQYPSAESDNASTKRGNGDGTMQIGWEQMGHVWESAKKGALGFFFLVGWEKERKIVVLGHVGVWDVEWRDVLTG